MIEDINKIDRFVEPPVSGFLCDLLWADPGEDTEIKTLKFSKNYKRECSFIFGADPVKKIINDNKLVTIIRAHEVQIEGYKFHKWGGPKAFPSVITLFSAPNYGGSYRNKGAVIILDSGKISIK